MQAYKETIKGIQERRNEKNNFYILRVHYTADDNKASQEWFTKTRMGMPKASWNKEYEIDFYALSGQRIWPDFSETTHVIPYFDIPKEWTRFRGIDFGQFNATCCLWLATDYDDNIYVYREYYESGRITASAHAKKITELSGDEEYVGTYIDPSTSARNQTKDFEAKDSIPYSIFEIFHDNGVDCSLANNDNRSGWDRVSDYMKLRNIYDGEGNIVAKKPKLFILKGTAPNLLREIPRYRYAQISPQMAAKSDPMEKQIKKEDHSCDALRYGVISRAPLPETKDKPLTRIQKDIRESISDKATMDVKAWTEFNQN